MCIRDRYTIVSGGGSVNEVAQNQQPWGDFKDHEETDEKSSKGMKSGKAMLIENGSFSINAHDDAIHSNTTIQIKKGTFTLKSDDDGIHAVSYTHLDVYKRQPSTIARSNSLFKILLSSIALVSIKTWQFRFG